MTSGNMASTGTYDRTKAVCLNMRMHISEEQEKCAIAPSSCHHTAEAVQMIPEGIHQQAHHINREPFNYSLWCLETFIDPARFKETGYKAANWQFLGLTLGSTKQGRGPRPKKKETLKRHRCSGECVAVVLNNFV